MRPPLPPSPTNKKVEAIDKILARAQALVVAGDPGEAIVELKRKNAAALGHPTGQVLLGQAEGILGHPERALAAFSVACRLAPTYPEAHYNRGIFLRRLGRPEEALAAYDAALLHRPGFIAARNNRALVLYDLGRHEEALAAYDAILRDQPDLAEAHFNRASVLVRLDRRSEALAAFDRALRLDPGNARGRLDRAALLAQLRRNEEAIAGYEAALAANPGLAEAELGLANVFLRLDRPADSLAAADRLVAGPSAGTAAHHARGAALNRLGRFEEAITAYDAALTIDPGNTGARLNRGVALNALGRPEEAIANYDELLARTPDAIEAASNRAAALHALGRFAEAEDAYSAILGRDPDFAEGHLGRSLTRLIAGRLAEGWDDYEYRQPDMTRQRVMPAELPALGLRAKDLTGRSVVIHREQGLGDALQFGRYIPLVRDIAASVAVELAPGMGRILGPVLSGVTVGEPLARRSGYDVELRLLSLPRIFGTELETIPRSVPYLFAEPEASAHWRSILGDAGFKIGINWQGNPRFVADRDRSIPLRHFAPLGAVPGVRLISLQKQHGLDQLTDLPPGMAVESMGPEYFAQDADKFVDTAAIMEGLDLVVTSDTATAHLAGALGRPVFVALSLVPDWRWLLERPDSPWYPTMRLFRQPRRGDWPAVFEALARAVWQKMAGS